MTTHIYIYPEKHVTVIKDRHLYLKDIAKLQGPEEVIRSIYPLHILEITEDKNKNYLISMMDVVELILGKNPEVVIHNLGVPEILVSYKTKPEKENQLLTYVKVVIVCLILVAGGAVAVMTFQSDAQLPNVFRKFYFILIGDNHTHPYVIEIPYAIGLVIGISAFFNHVSKLRFSDDPTPIQVELKLYESQMEECMIQDLKDEQEEQSR